MASSKKKKSPKKPAAKKKAAPKTKTKVKAKAKPAGKKAKKAAPKTKKSAAKKPAPKKTKKAEAPTHGDAWGNASLAPKVAKTTPKTTSLEPSGTPTLALHDHEGGLISPVDDEETIAERIHGGEEAVKDADEDTGSPRLDDREDTDSEE